MNFKGGGDLKRVVAVNRLDKTVTLEGDSDPRGWLDVEYP